MTKVQKEKIAIERWFLWMQDLGAIHPRFVDDAIKIVSKAHGMPRKVLENSWHLLLDIGSEMQKKGVDKDLDAC